LPRLNSSEPVAPGDGPPMIVGAPPPAAAALWVETATEL